MSDLTDHYRGSVEQNPTHYAWTWRISRLCTDAPTPYLAIVAESEGEFSTRDEAKQALYDACDRLGGIVLSRCYLESPRFVGPEQLAVPTHLAA